jgi:hypothetical protein
LYHFIVPNSSAAARSPDSDDQLYLFEIGTPPLVSLPHSVQTNGPETHRLRQKRRRDAVQFDDLNRDFVVR